MAGDSQLRHYTLATSILYSPALKDLKVRACYGTHIKNVLSGASINVSTVFYSVVLWFIII